MNHTLFTILSDTERWFPKPTKWQLTLCCALGMAASVQAASHRPNKAVASKEDKVLICHKGHDIIVSASAVQSHLSQHPGDKVGSCADNGGGVGGPARTAATPQR